MKRFFASILLGSTITASNADIISFDGFDVDIESTVGTGASEAMIFFDWHIGTTPQHAWLYRWDGSNSLDTAYTTIGTATAGDFDYVSGWPGKLDYHDGAEQHLSDTAGNISYWNSEVEDLSGFGLTRTNTLNMVLYTNPFGASGMELLDGGWYGARADTDHTGPDSGPNTFGTWPGPAPLPPVILAVPEPGVFSLALIGVGSLALLRRRT